MISSRFISITVAYLFSVFRSIHFIITSLSTGFTPFLILTGGTSVSPISLDIASTGIVPVTRRYMVAPRA